MEKFHGGCIDCTMQDSKGLGYCVGCCYFDANWNLPNLNDSAQKELSRIEKVKEKAREIARNEGKYPKEKVVIINIFDTILPSILK